MSENVTPTGRQAAVLALACGETIADAARKAAVAVRTVHRWRREEGFRQEVAVARAEMFHRALGRLAEGAVTSVLMLRQLCLKGKSETVRLAAARAILEQGAKFQQLMEIQDQIEELEQKLKQRNRK
jgi:hypothetical protein